MLRFRVFVAAVFTLCAAFAQQPAAAPPSPEAPPKPMTQQQALEMATNLMQAHIGWGPELNSPGATLAIKEIAREGGTVSLGLHATGLPKDKVYVLFQWPVTQVKPVPALRGVTFDDNGIAVCAGRPGTCGKADKPNDPIELTAVPALGEPFRFAVAAEDDPNIKAYAKVVPMPVEAEDKGCRLRGVVLMPHGLLIGVEASGYPADTVIDFHSDSAGEVQDSRPKTDAKGRYLTAVLPVKAGVAVGNVRIRASAGQCKPEISLPWTAPPTGPPNGSKLEPPRE